MKRFHVQAHSVQTLILIDPVDLLERGGDLSTDFFTQVSGDTY